jgi:sulfatase maturation enzyme AslB (radical SAM superfamily)
MNDKICILPWTHLQVFPTGVINPCCQSQLNLGNIKDKTLDEVMNGEIMSNVRLDMLAGRENDICLKCYRKEDSGSQSMRNLYNDMWGVDKIEEEIKNTNSDGTLKEKFKYKNIPLRISNLCNYGCRMCWSGSSSLIGQERGIINFVKKSTDNRPSFINELLEHMEYVEYLVIMGGEPILIKEHDILLERIIELGRQDQVEIIYFSNLSKLQHHGRSLVEYSRIFKKFTIKASVEAMGERLEVFRYGSSWQNVEKNITELFNNDVKVDFFPAISALNVYDFPDFFKYIIERGWVTDNIDINIVDVPPELNPRVLPSEIKQQTTKRYLDLQEWIKNRSNIDNEKLIAKCQEVIDYINSRDDSNLLSKFVEFNKQIDNTRGQNFQEVFPELRSLK